MKEFKGTPGPWIIKEIELYEDGSKGFEVTNENGDIVCNNQTYYPHAVSVKDAHLIAAAPELLEALFMALKALEAIGNEITIGERYTDAGQYLIDALEPSRAAIAKALGE